MLEYFAEYELKTAQAADWTQFLAGSERFMLTVAPLHTGFIDNENHVAVVTENELYAAQVRQRAVRDAKRTSPEGMLRDLSEVKIGDPVVHETHGIGRYLGLQTLDLGEGSTEFLTLEYAKEDKLYVPVSSLHLISRYSGAAPEQAPLHQLGSGQWDKAKKKAAAQVHDTAAELLALYAQRATREGHAFSLKPHDYEAFAEGFPFEETSDQAAAINATLDDLKSTKPMDRLICGDVGFGKTEVALRAAFVAVADGKQVAVLVPTTLLAEQHFNTFSDRFADWPVKVAELSRFRSAKETTEALHGLAEGRVDIAIGTHKLIGRDVKFKNLGLVILDEEHRFGVRQKERLKALRAEVDVLTLTATPIPRTLALSLEGLRDFSVIATAPQRRLAIKTFVARYAKSLIREAVLRELKRGGQIYFLHNDIDTIRNVEEELTRLLPEARIRIAHGQMRERELELAMRDFYQGRFNVLLCTTIIETGIDIPTANTIIINRADRFGLAQLHQLRGRVGRSHHQAYAYLLLPDEGNITSQREKAARSDPVDGRTGLGLFPRDARPRDPRRRRSTGRIAVGRNPGNRFQSLLRDARQRGEIAEGRQGPGPQRPAGRHHRNQPARAGAAARGLLQRRARAAGAVQAAGKLRRRRAAATAAGGTGRPFRRAAGSHAHADRQPPAAPAGQAAGHRAHRRQRQRDPAAVRAQPADRTDENHHADPDPKKLQARRSGPAPDRSQDAGPEGAHRGNPQGVHRTFLTCAGAAYDASTPTTGFAMFASVLIAASAAVIFTLGLIHLLYTFRGTKLHPRAAELEASMKTVSPVITRQTTMWKAWIGFNASHSYGALLFGAVYAYLALAHGTFLFASPFLLALGALLLAGYIALGKLYWFSVPYRGILLSSVLYAAGLVAGLI